MQEVLDLDIAELEKEVLFPTYDRLPIGVVRSASGVHITTDKGVYLDAIAGLGVNALGHSHQDIIAAIEEQVQKYLHLSNLYLQEPQVALGEKLRALSGWDRVFFTNSGTEAVEGALKLARKYFSKEDKTELIGLHNAFHGRTYGALSVMDKEKYKNGYGPFLDNSHSVPYSIEGITSTVSNKTAAVILEVIQGEGGIFEIPVEFVNAVHKLREKFGFLIIADEIQSGIGRTGKFFAYEHYSLKPDVVVAAKAIGGGLPLGAILSTNKIANALSAGVHGTTFGGNALACAAGLIVLNHLENGLMEQVQNNSQILYSKLAELQTEFPAIVTEIRGKGFMLGLELSRGAKEVQQQLLNKHVIANLTAQNVIRLLPPLIFEESNIEELIAKLRDAIASLP